MYMQLNKCWKTSKKLHTWLWLLNIPSRMFTVYLWYSVVTCRQSNRFDISSFCFFTSSTSSLLSSSPLIRLEFHRQKYQNKTIQKIVELSRANNFTNPGSSNQKACPFALNFRRNKKKTQNIKRHFPVSSLAF